MIYHNGGSDFVGLEQAVARAADKLRPHTEKFDCIVVQGVSGQCVGFPLALRLGKPILVLRKEDEDSHGLGGELLNRRALRWGGRALFVDDFIVGGTTMGRCKAAVEQASGEIVGTYLYRDGRVEWHAEVPQREDEIPF